MKRTLSLLIALFAAWVIAGPLDVVNAQGRGAGGRRGGPPATTTPPPTQPPTAQPPTPARPDGPPAAAEGAGRGRGRQTPPAGPADAARGGRPAGAGTLPAQAGAGRGRGEAETAPAEAAGRGRGVGAQQDEYQEQVPVWARERRPPTASELIAHNPQLAAQLQKLLPGTDLQAASAGFSNLGQLVAAVHVSNNLKIPFDQLKTKMVTERMSLGQAIQALRPEADADAAAGRAAGQARRDLEDLNDD
ncbi:MAG: hypothetical protein HYY76_02755 [Acidobacteria bacterium]|nr:hypothetical protein [Acidobacteriota bacterium]